MESNESRNGAKTVSSTSDSSPLIPATIIMLEGAVYSRHWGSDAAEVVELPEEYLHHRPPLVQLKNLMTGRSAGQASILMGAQWHHSR